MFSSCGPECFNYLCVFCTNELFCAFQVTCSFSKYRRLKNYTEADGTSYMKIEQTEILKRSPPYNMTIMKNLAYNIYYRAFLDWVFYESTKAKELLEWSRDTLTPDEHIWAMLDSIEDAPGRTGSIHYLHPYISWNPNGPCLGTVRKMFTK